MTDCKMTDWKLADAHWTVTNCTLAATHAVSCGLTQRRQWVQKPCNTVTDTMLNNTSVDPLCTLHSWHLHGDARFLLKHSPVRTDYITDGDVFALNLNTNTSCVYFKSSVHWCWTFVHIYCVWCHLCPYLSDLYKPVFILLNSSPSFSSPPIFAMSLFSPAISTPAILSVIILS